VRSANNRFRESDTAALHPSVEQQVGDHALGIGFALQAPQSANHSRVKMRFVSFLAVPMISLVACSHAQPAPPPAAQVIAEPAPVEVAAPVAAPAPAPVKLAAASVYFDFDSAELSEPTRAALQAFFDLARQGYDQAIRIEGNCDERGSREYNLALGQRRADAAKKYLADLGLPASRIVTISFGNERPRAPGHDEEAWRENRRDDLVPITQTSNAVSQASR